MRLLGWRTTAVLTDRLRRFVQPYDGPTLLPLTPEYVPARHEVYVEAIADALLAPNGLIRNIALTGSYGVGKSSILLEIARRYKRRSVSLSLSSLGLGDVHDSSKQDSSQPESAKTLQIQKEIVKQLLYSQDPITTPGSRYHRPTRLRFWRSAVTAMLLSIPVVLVFFLTGWTASLAPIVPFSADLPWVTPTAVFVGSAVFILGLTVAFHNRIQIEKLGTGAGSISLSKPTATFFDEYLDEIVYLFEVSGRDIVIFEDIDRFDDARIFETLRSLNAILNGAKQLRNRQIQFIYAIKDSIFDELGIRAAKEELSEAQSDSAEAEVARANRTKFFDLVVPVVPFVTHRSARDHVIRTLKDQLEHTVSDRLIDVAARHVADMRLIKNLRNEFAVFKRQIIDSGSLDLKQDKLFAMMLYKSTHLSDFEAIKHGKSDLDQVYSDHRAIVDEHMRLLSMQIRDARNQRTHNAAAPETASRFGDRVRAHISNTFRQMGFTPTQFQSLTFAGAAVSDEELRTVQFWQTFADSETTTSMQLPYVNPTYGRWDTLTLTHSDIEEILGENADPSAWTDETGDDLDRKIAAATAQREFLSTAEMSDLAKRPEFALSTEGGQSFKGLLERRLKSPLAITLVEGGYIDSHFTLYTSTFETDRVSANAMNYMLKSVYPGVVDLHFPLSTGDAASIIRERGRGILTEPAACNVSFLDYLLLKDPAGLNDMLDRILDGGEQEENLLLAYYGASRNVIELTQALAPRWDRIFPFLTSEIGNDDAARLELVDAALNVADPGVTYQTDSAVGSYVIDNLGRLPSLASKEHGAGTARSFAELVQRADAVVPSLLPLADDIRESLVDNGAYAVTADNLRIVLNADPKRMSLDAIAATDKRVYLRVLADLDAYLTVLEDDAETVTAPSSFVTTIKDVFDAHPGSVPTVIERASQACLVDALHEVPKEVWADLAEHDRFPVTFSNVVTYHTELGLDDSLTERLLVAGELLEVEAIDAEAKLAFAIILLNASAEIPSPETRAELVTSLDLDAYIEASEIPVETGELVGQLLIHDIVEDTSHAFTRVPTADLNGLAFAIAQSDQYVTFMTPSTLSPTRVAELIRHAGVPNEVKGQFVDRFTEFTAGASAPTLEVIARYAQSQRLALTVAEIELLAREGVNQDLVLALLSPLLPSLDMGQIGPVLAQMSDEYRKLARRTGKRPNLDATADNRALISRLKQLDVVSSFSEREMTIRVIVRPE